MKLSLTFARTGLLALAIYGSQVYAMGQRAQLFENASEAGIWDHGSEFYLRMDLTEISGLTNQKFVWAGFHEESPNVFRGEVVVDDFGVNERRMPARARLMHSSASARYFLIEVLDPAGAVIKEFFLKGPKLPHTPAR